jgi:hypothetical protein
VYYKYFLVVHQYSSESFVSTNDLAKLLEERNEFKSELFKELEISSSDIEVFHIGNAKALIQTLHNFDSQCKKIDIKTQLKDVFLQRLLDSEKAIFEIFNIQNADVLYLNRSDRLLAETRYSAKNDLLDIYNFSKFANYCKGKDYEDLIETIKNYLKEKNTQNEDPINLRLIYSLEDSKFYIRAITSSEGYKDFGINFSVFVAIVALGRYVRKAKNEIFIDNYSVNESELYVSFQLKREIIVNKELKLAVSLILENDEIKRNAVSFNGVCKLKYSKNLNISEIFIKPRGVKKEGQSYEVDLLTYPHRGSVQKVIERIGNLEKVIEIFIDQITEDTPKISSISNPNDVKKHIADKVKYSKKKEFQQYKKEIFSKLMKVQVDNTFGLFELLRSIEDLFEHEDVVSRDFWRTKLYEALVEGR